MRHGRIVGLTRHLQRAHSVQVRLVHLPVQLDVIAIHDPALMRTRAT
jgi:hypothetical protein